MTDTDKTTSTLPSTGDAKPKATETPEAKSFLERAQEAIADAIESTVDAVKENPLTAAAIAGGVVAAAAGAVYGVSKLVEVEDAPEKK